jgi:Cu+-exporting ATPase
VSSILSSVLTSFSSSFLVDITQQAMKDKILLLAVTSEQDSDHPLAKAIQKEAEISKIMPLPLSSGNSTKLIIGNGISCDSSLGKIYVGNRKFMKQCNIPLSTIAESEMWNLEIQGKTAISVALNDVIYGIIGIADTPKEEAQFALRALKAMGMDLWMLTGDNPTTAEALGNKLEISSDRILSNMLPEDKVMKIQELQSKGAIVAMVGDGINDSAALIQSHLGIALGAGTQIAIESASMVLIRNNLNDLVVALDLAKIVFQRIKWNFLWAVLYNFLAIPFAAGLWFPLTHTLLPPHYAGLSMALSSISVVISSMMLKRYQRPKGLKEPNQKKKQHEGQGREDDILRELSSSNDSFSSFSSDEEDVTPVTSEQTFCQR